MWPTAGGWIAILSVLLRDHPIRPNAREVNVALVNCPECGRPVSTAALACPHCGHPRPGAAPAAPTPAGTGSGEPDLLVYREYNPWGVFAVAVVLTLLGTGLGALPAVGVVTDLSAGKTPATGVVLFAVVGLGFFFWGLYCAAVFAWTVRRGRGSPRVVLDADAVHDHQADPPVVIRYGGIAGVTYSVHRRGRELTYKSVTVRRTDGSEHTIDLCRLDIAASRLADALRERVNSKEQTSPRPASAPLVSPPVGVDDTAREYPSRGVPYDLMTVGGMLLLVAAIFVLVVFRDDNPKLSFLIVPACFAAPGLLLTGWGAFRLRERIRVGEREVIVPRLFGVHRVEYRDILDVLVRTNDVRPTAVVLRIRYGERVRRVVVRTARAAIAPLADDLAGRVRR